MTRNLAQDPSLVAQRLQGYTCEDCLHYVPGLIGGPGDNCPTCLDQLKALKKKDRICPDFSLKSGFPPPRQNPVPPQTSRESFSSQTNRREIRNIAQTQKDNDQ